MSHYIMIRRLRGPAILLLLGGVALLDQTGVIHHFWGWFIPLLLIMLGIFMLAERAAIAAEGGYPPGFCCGQPYPGAYPGGTPPSTAENSANVSASSQEFQKNSQGGKS
ncbi:MAG TPA: hypothetical protein VKF63_03260 [Terracidiphilus sp.]|nr:hypothetical protein [Terracidiphilus sp.]